VPRSSKSFDASSRAARITGAVLLALPFVLVLALAYAAYRQGSFERQHPYRLLAKNAAGIRSGTPVEFSGFPIGSVESVRLDDSGEAEITIVVADRHLRWVRADSAFSLQQPLLGSAKIVVDTRELKNPILPAGSTRRLGSESPLEQLLAQAMPLLADLRTLARALGDPAGPLQRTLGNAQRLSARMADEGIASAVTANARTGREIDATLAQARAAVAQLGKALDHADRRLLGAGGSVDKIDANLVETVETLKTLRASLQGLTRILGHGERIAAEAAGGAEDLAVLRGRIDQAVYRSDEILKRVDSVLSRPQEATLP
jgi:phospholipid/cholesterol/gamma-HCH transport system substrate-binding protein